jgi:hypothetical protein
MTVSEAQDYYQKTENIFNSKNNIIDLSIAQTISRRDAEANSELVRFTFLDEDGPWTEYLKSGLKSLRYGFYKICSQPYYNNSISPGTFAATVLYLHPENSKLIKYNCNIGPMTNVHKLYKPILGTPNHINQLPILNKFEHDKISIGHYSDDYMIPKRNFFNSLYINGVLFFIRESKWHPNYPNLIPRPKEVTWSFLKPQS